MSLADTTYGSFGTPLGSGTPAVTSTATKNDPTKATHATRAMHLPSSKHAVPDEPGAKTAAPHSAKSIMDNPTTWLIVTIGLAVIAGRVAKTGRVL